MRVRLMPFGVLKESIDTAPLELPARATVGDLLEAVGHALQRKPAARQLLSSIAVSVNAEYARPDRVLQEGDEVGLLPPVSGGDSDAIDVAGDVVTYLTREPILIEETVANIKRGSDGAVVVFDGIVRDNTRGRKTLFLDYEAYEEMAAKQITELAQKAIGSFGVRAVTLIHRLGRLEIGETSVLIVVASAHRAAAFEANRWLIDTLKKTVPIWKRETFENGSVWADGEPFPVEIGARLQEVVSGSDGRETKS